MDLKGAVFGQPGLLRDSSLGRISAWFTMGLPRNFYFSFFLLRIEFQIHCHDTELSEAPACKPSSWKEISFSPFKPLTAGKTNGRPASQDWLTRVFSFFASGTPKRYLESMPCIICQQLDCHWLRHVTLTESLRTCGENITFKARHFPTTEPDSLCAVHAF